MLLLPEGSQLVRAAPLHHESCRHKGERGVTPLFRMKKRKNGAEKTIINASPSRKNTDSLMNTFNG